jgi:cysteine-rich repeat protein
VPGWDCLYLRKWGSNKCILEVCGDGKVTKSEECDDKGTTNGDGCSSTCKVERGYRCFQLSGNNFSSCGLEIRCGNGYKNLQEECDDGNEIDGDGCNSTCWIEPGWICVSPKDSSSKCHILHCGDGLTEGQEQCDDGNNDDGDGCSANCTTEAGFTCSGTKCRAYCGNGIRSVTEECDDGNRINDDGCDSTCKVEVGWNCSDAPNCTVNCRSICASTCGDGILASNEECDDGNLWIGDGCSPQCEIETQWRCSGVPSTCEAKLCNLVVNSSEVTHVRCGGAATGEIRVLASGRGIVTYRLAGPGRIMPPWEAAAWWINLVAGNYTVTATLDSDPECTLAISLQVQQPNPLVAGSLTLKAPTKCNTEDGAMVWMVFGGTAPFAYTLGTRNQTNGTFTGLTAMDFGIITATDANGCVVKTPADEVPAKQECVYLGFDKFIRDVWSRGGLAGVIVIGATAGIALVGMIGYCMWDHQQKKKEDREDEAAEAAEAARLSQVDAAAPH